MPLYSYDCEDCGPFNAFAPISAYQEPCACPACGTAAPRSFSLPRMSILSAGNRSAHETNERAQHEPKSTKTHGPGCSCCSGSSKKPSRTLHRPDGSKSFPSARPWMISH